MLKLLSLLPGAKWAELAAVLLIAGLITGALLSQHNTILAQRAEISKVQAARDADRAAYAVAAASAATDNLNETGRRVAAQAEIANESERFSTRARADAVVRVAADSRLQPLVAAIAARCGAAPGDSAAPAVGPAASSPGDLLAYVQRRMGEAAAGVVGYADDLRPAAEQCVGDYDALTPTVSTALPRARLGGG